MVPIDLIQTRYSTWESGDVAWDARLLPGAGVAVIDESGHPVPVGAQRRVEYYSFVAMEFVCNHYVRNEVWGLPEGAVQALNTPNSL